MKVSIEKSTIKDAQLFERLLLEPDVLEFFPMWGIKEIKDSVRVWEMYCKKETSLTSYVDGKACGLAYLNIQVYKKFSHQCLLTIIVDKNYRNQGVGTKLIEEVILLGKKKFGIELLHLEVYEGNPAINLYKRLGFEEFGIHRKWLKDNGKYIGKIFMQRSI